MRLSSDRRSSSPPVRLKEAAIPGHATVVAQVIKLCLPGTRDADRPRINVPERVVSQALGQIGKELPFTIKICSLAVHDCSGGETYVEESMRVCKKGPARRDVQAQRGITSRIARRRSNQLPARAPTSPMTPAVPVTTAIWYAKMPGSAIV